MERIGIIQLTTIGADDAVAILVANIQAGAIEHIPTGVGAGRVECLSESFLECIV